MTHPSWFNSTNVREPARHTEVSNARQLLKKIALAALLKINGERFHISLRRVLISIQQKDCRDFPVTCERKVDAYFYRVEGGIPKAFHIYHFFIFFFFYFAFIRSPRAQASLLLEILFQHPAVYICCLHLDELPDERSSHTGIKYGISSVYTSPGSGICHECNAGSPASFLPGPGSASQRLPLSAGRTGKADHGPANGSCGDRPPLLLAGASSCGRPPQASQDSWAWGGGGGRPQSSPGSQGALGTLPQERHRDGDHKIRKVNKIFFVVVVVFISKLSHIVSKYAEASCSYW